eukprot:SAG11_NODE_6083_length_1391_cov_2.107585_1_plen_201_part_00
MILVLLYLIMPSFSRPSKCKNECCLSKTRRTGLPIARHTPTHQPRSAQSLRAHGCRGVGLFIWVLTPLFTLHKPSSASAVTLCVPPSIVFRAIVLVAVAEAARAAVSAAIASVGAGAAAASAAVATTCMSLATIAGEAVSLRIAVVARPLRAHTTSATRGQASTVSAIAIDDWAQVLDAVGAVRVANLPSGRLAALCDHP